MNTENRNNSLKDWKLVNFCEFDKYAMQVYNAIHGTNFGTTDITNVKGGDLGITNKSEYTYLLTYSFP